VKKSDEDALTYYEAMNGPDARGYQEAMQLEIAQLKMTKHLDPQGLS